MRKIRLFCLVVVLTAGTSLGAAGQTDPGPCDTCWKHWQYDSTFTMGGHIVQSIDDAIDLYRFELTQDYGLDPAKITALLDDTTYALRWIDSGAHPWGGFWVDSGAVGMANGVHNQKRIGEAHDRRRFQKALERGYKVVAHPGLPPSIMKAAVVRESWLVLPGDFQPFYLCELPPQDTVSFANPSEEIAPWRRQFLDSVTGGFHWTYTVGDTTIPDTVMLAGRPDFARTAFGIDKRAYGLYEADKGAPLNGDDSAQVYRLSLGFAFWTDQEQLNDELLDSNTVIAYADLFVRDRTESDTCNCYTLRPWKRIEFTKGDYLDRVAAEDYNGTKIFQALFDQDRARSYYDLDTLLDFEPVWGTVSNYFGDRKNNPVYELTKEVEGDTITFDSTFHCREWCEARVAWRMSLDDTAVLWLPPGSYSAEYADGGDFSFRFYTTRIVPVSLLRSRIARHAFEELRAGTYDHLIEDAVASVYSDPRVDSLVGRIGIGDEIGTTEHRSWSILASKVQRFMDEDPVGAEHPKQFWINPPHNPDGFRLFTGDFDSTEYRQVHMAARQRYLINSDDPIPVFYADIDSLGVEARDTLLRLNQPDYLNPKDATDTIRVRMIVGSHPQDYLYYRGQIQKNFGLFADYDTPLTNSQGPGIPATARLVDVMRFKYRDRFPNVPSAPVWNVVQTHGHMVNNDTLFAAQGFNAGWGPSRIPTPEEIRAQAWLSINSGVSGLIFGDFVYDGSVIGLVSNNFDSVHSYSNIEYGLLRATNQSVFSDTDPRFRVDSMWLGFGSRHNAVSEVTREIHHVDTLIGWHNLEYSLEQMSVHDTRQEFDVIPLVDRIMSERARTHTFNTVGGGFDFVGSDTIDGRDETFLEVTHFKPLPGAGTYYEDGSRFLLITNKLTWPVDLKTYAQASVDTFNARVADFPTTAAGLGAIDVRRPLIVFENPTELISDSLLVERIDSQEPWSGTFAFGDTAVLPWHRPGVGRLYRVRPIPAGVSREGVAFNNAVRSENPSTNAEDRPWTTVYERDSAVWLRTYSEGTGWGPAWLISDAGDSAYVNVIHDSAFRRLAHNSLPSLASVRNDSAVLVVWQRVDTNNVGTVRGLIVPGPPTLTNLASATAIQLSTNQSMTEDGMLLTPSVVGIDSGWVVAWGASSGGIDIVGVRHDGSVTPNDLSARKNIRAEAIFFPRRKAGTTPPTNLIDSVALFPSLAYVEDSTGPFLGQEGTLRRVHIAWQQGGHDTSGATLNKGPYIFYHCFGVEWATGGKPAVYTDEKYIEHVTQGLAGCSFYHPSLAVDSTRVGVAFESHQQILTQNVPALAPIGNIRTVTLRFRDSSRTGGWQIGNTPWVALPWATPAYYWGDSATEYGYPSLTEFPAMSELSLLFTPQGGLSWFDVADSSTQKLYRYGQRYPADLPNGTFPTMSMAPYVKSSPLNATGALYRGAESTSFERARGWGETAIYYPSNLLNGETSGDFDFQSAFAVIPAGTGISSFFSIGSWEPVSSSDACNFAHVHGGFLRDFPFLDSWPDHKGDGADPPIGPGFFGSTRHGDSWTENPSQVAGVVSRSGVFTAGAAPVTFARYVSRTSNAISWLNTFPIDTTLNSLPDIKVLTELVTTSGTVLWTDDTLSVRDMSGRVQSDLVVIPVDTYAMPGDSVFVRLRPVPTQDMEYSLSGGYLFYEGSTSGSFSKVVHPRELWPGETSDMKERESKLRVDVVPNPARARARVRVRVIREGSVTLSIWSSLGKKLAELPALNVEGPGDYTVDISLSGVLPGPYLLRAGQQGESTTVQFNVVR